ncbi:hypothetical protein [Ornithinibacillus sp. JPR2-1]|uniref:hypothetical protein n=1 Tax=Ornithinibacillus sp. JPR2-1 TaxID=2094019 RepID=UPI0031DA4C30
MNTFKVSYGASTDNGYTYAYYVEAIGQNDRRKFESDVIQLENKSGMEGYSIVNDTNPTTIPDDTIETTGTSYALKEKHFNKDLYLHVAAIDKAGNKSVSHFKIEKPELTIQASNSWTNGNVVLTITRKGDWVGKNHAAQWYRDDRHFCFLYCNRKWHLDLLWVDEGRKRIGNSILRCCQYRPGRERRADRSR